jgi:hypothetical protein
VERFGRYQLSKRLVRVGSDCLRKEMSTDRLRLNAIKICAECILLSRRNERDRELLRELREELWGIMSEVDRRLAEYESKRCGGERLGYPRGAK